MKYPLNMNREAHKEFRLETREAFKKFRPLLSKLYQQEKSEPISKDVWLLMAKLGWFGCVIPSQYGGNERGLRAICESAMEITGAGLMPYPATLTALAAICMGKFGSDELKQKYLPQIAKGEIKFAFAATEDRAGFNMLEIDTFAEKRDGSYFVKGSKAYVSGFDVCEYMLLVARTMTFEECAKKGLPKTAGISLFVVETSAKGIVKRQLHTRGEGHVKQFALAFEDLEISSDDLVGKEHQGAAALFSAFNIERLIFVAFALGSIQYCLDVACEHARNRKVFRDTPIGKYQSIQHPLADAKIRMEAVKAMLIQAIDAIDNGEDAAKIATLVNSAKYLASEAGLKAVDAAMEALGGKGFNEDFGLIQLWELMRLLKLSPISNSLILNDVAEKVLELPRSY